jgi:hypothetical protein
MHCDASGSFNPVAAELAIRLHMANDGFNSASALDHRLEPTRDTAPLIYLTLMQTVTAGLWATL